MTTVAKGPIVNMLSTRRHPARGMLLTTDLLLQKSLETVTVSPAGYPWIWVFSGNLIAITGKDGLTSLYGLETVQQIFPFLYLIPELKPHFNFNFNIFVKLCAVNKLTNIRKLSSRSLLLPHGEIKATDFFFDYLSCLNHAWALKDGNLINTEMGYGIVFNKNSIEIPGKGVLFFSDALALNYILAGYFNVSNDTREAVIGFFAKN